MELERGGGDLYRGSWIDRGERATSGSPLPYSTGISGSGLFPMSSGGGGGNGSSSRNGGGSSGSAGSSVCIIHGNESSGRLEIEVPENLIGAVLGKQMKSLQELQHVTNTRIDVSKRGDLVPGTNNRTLTIAGSPDKIRIARQLIERRIGTEKESRDARHGPLGGGMGGR